MKLKYQSAVWSLALGALTLASCSSEDFQGPDTELGKVSLFGLDVSNVEKVMNDNAGAARAVYDVSEFIVEFYLQGSDTPCQTYVYGDMPGAVELPVGTYYAKVRSHNLQKAEWEKPYFTGQSAPFTISAGEITEVDPVVCTFSSLKVSIKFGPKLTAAAGNDVKVTVVANDEGELTYAIDETRAGYFATVDGSTTLVATLSGTVNGYFEEGLVRTYTDVAAGQHRIITYELGAGVPTPDEPSGSIGTDGIQIDVTYEDENLTGIVDPGKEDVLPNEDEPGTLPDILGGDEPGPDTPPTPPVDDPITFSGTLTEHADGIYINTEMTSKANVTINCANKCKDVSVKIDSDFLTADELQSMAGLPTEFSLTNPDYYDAIASLQLPYGDAVINKDVIDFDITMFMSLLGAGKGSTNVFTINVTDNAGETDTITFTIKVPQN